MEFPDLMNKVRLIYSTEAFSIKEMAEALGKAQSSISKFLAGKTKDLAGMQDDIVAAVCRFYNAKYPERPKLTRDLFFESEITHFGLLAGIPRIDIARFTGGQMPVLDAFFASSGAASIPYHKQLSGWYVIYRAAIRIRPGGLPYVKGYACIKRERGLLCYEDHWESESYSGFVFPVGKVINFISEDKDAAGLKEVFWCGLTAEGYPASFLYGYASDTDSETKLPLAYKILYKRCLDEDVWRREWEAKRFSADAEELGELAVYLDPPGRVV